MTKTCQTISPSLKSYRNRKYGGQYYIVFDRDNFSCQTCKTKRNLCVHHIDGNGYSSDNPNNNINNLIVLCNSCHGRLHRSQQIFEKNLGKIVKCNICHRDRPLYNVKRNLCRNCYGISMGHFNKNKVV